mgnify:CR=1 FL=1
MFEDITLTTIETIPGADVEEHYGLVTGTAVKTLSKFSSFISSMKMFFGGELTGYTTFLEEARKEATKHMIDEAKKLGANAVVSVKYEVAATAPGIIEISAYGTATKIVKY